MQHPDLPARDERRSRGVRMMVNTFKQTEKCYNTLQDYMLQGATSPSVYEVNERSVGGGRKNKGIIKATRLCRSDKSNRKCKFCRGRARQVTTPCGGLWGVTYYRNASDERVPP